ncbi:hypothetical protein [Elizabethkingia anophelis]|uniref:hypothetical protein n=1 Tax=Elizabethkingia anophelis TaxID=1117645 RepID=UPI002983BC2D|nr:hypothetical protein [Elizabethkingia anophelis]HAY3533731.1 hypothetical protein [Elizabethkingia anophelis]HAY3545847.1 hypothetical protein [Elizabethkingia anophelis]HAY3590673.1 hypothetical protein [Elizabethkingia anophelis]
MNPQEVLKNIPFLVNLLKDRNTYYVIVLGLLAAYIWKQDNDIAELKSDKIKLENQINELRNKDCVEEFRVWQQALAVRQMEVRYADSLVREQTKDAKTLLKSK